MLGACVSSSASCNSFGALYRPPTPFPPLKALVVLVITETIGVEVLYSVGMAIGLVMPALLTVLIAFTLPRAT